MLGLLCWRWSLPFVLLCVMVVVQSFFGEVVLGVHTTEAQTDSSFTLHSCWDCDVLPPALRLVLGAFLAYLYWIGGRLDDRTAIDDFKSADHLLAGATGFAAASAAAPQAPVPLALLTPSALLLAGAVAVRGRTRGWPFRVLGGLCLGFAIITLIGSITPGAPVLPCVLLVLGFALITPGTRPRP
jgi:hypothetical protein